MNRQLWMFPNVLSILRIVLVAPIAILLMSDRPNGRFYAVGLIVVAIATDYFDGLVARKRHQVTDTGKIIDPLADKIAVGVVCVVLAGQGELPMWFVLLAIVRDILILAGGLYIKKKKGILLQSNIIGKWTVGIIAMYIFFVILKVDAIAWLNNVLLVASIVMLVISFAMYVQRFVRTINVNEANINSEI